ncbi:MAG: M15 family metallopeptidase [Nocardioides sp.]|uniref:M15 family metallopeptidase n=1 Tax=Nocardioides sp. TaxID=35761 RepID=UPI003F035E8B
MTLLLSDPRVRAVPLAENGEPLVALSASLSPDLCPVRLGVAQRLELARQLLPTGFHLLVREGHRSMESQRAIIARYTAEVCAHHPGVGPAELESLVSRFVAPADVAGHVSGSAVDVTLRDGLGRELDLGCPLDATPEQSGGRCFTDSRDVRGEARRNRRLLGEVLGEVGFVNYPTEWWHWSWGDRYWAITTGAPSALHGPVGQLDVVHHVTVSQDVA